MSETNQLIQRAEAKAEAIQTAARQKKQLREEYEQKVRDLVTGIREKMEMTRYEFGQALGTSSNHVSKWEDGKSYPTSPMLLMILDLEKKFDENPIKYLD